jgi:hypothetical protein
VTLHAKPHAAVIGLATTSLQPDVCVGFLDRASAGVSTFPSGQFVTEFNLLPAHVNSTQSGIQDCVGNKGCKVTVR